MGLLRGTLVVFLSFIGIVVLSEKFSKRASQNVMLTLLVVYGGIIIEIINKTRGGIQIVLFMISMGIISFLAPLAILL